MDNRQTTPQKLFCAECGKNFVHYMKGVSQEVCGVCAEMDYEVEW